MWASSSDRQWQTTKAHLAAAHRFHHSCCRTSKSLKQPQYVLPWGHPQKDRQRSTRRPYCSSESGRQNLSQSPYFQTAQIPKLHPRHRRSRQPSSHPKNLHHLQGERVRRLFPPTGQYYPHCRWSRRHPDIAQEVRCSLD